MLHRVWLLAAALLLSLIVPLPSNRAHAQDVDQVTEELLRFVFPDATRFSDKEGDPPVYRAFAPDPATGAERHVGFVFLTSDIPPETVGYTAPIRVLVGMDLNGTLTGIRVLSYRESLRSNRGDFLARPGVQGQFRGKSILDEFRVRRDVETVTGATITMIAMSTGIRNAARRVAAAYMSRARTAGGEVPRIGTISLDELSRYTWPEIAALEMSAELTADVRASDLLRISVLYIRDEAMLEAVVGRSRFAIAQQAAQAVPDRHMMFWGVNGPPEGGHIFGFLPESISFVQAGDTVRLTEADYVNTGLISDGLAGGVFRRTGVLFVPPELNVREPFTVLITLADGRTITDDYVVYPPPSAAPTVVAGQADAPGAADTAAAAQSDSPEALAAATGTPDQQAISAFDFSDEQLAELLSTQDVEEEGSTLSRTIGQASWGRVLGLLLVLTLATWAFVSKRTKVRWIALGATIAFLGFLDRGFLSVSHILSGISTGPEVYISDLSLMIMVAFVVITTLFWGRIFCGFLCPFGAIQDLLDHVVPKRFKRELPRALHERALWTKYGILGIVLTPAIVGAPFTLYHWFEPFGTVFFWSPSIVLWAIAIGILTVSAIVPRFYCRYMCPLGASLAIGSLLSPFRIKRVEQCSICTVCERGCPTGAIKREKIDFKECVRCNACETKLIEKAGVCRHDMARVRNRLVQITPAEKVG